MNVKINYDVTPNSTSAKIFFNFFCFSAFLKLYAIKTIPALRLVDIDGNVVDDGARAKVEVICVTFFRICSVHDVSKILYFSKKLAYL